MPEEESEDIRMARKRLNDKVIELRIMLAHLDTELDEIKEKAEYYRGVAENLGITDIEDKFLKMREMKIVGWW